MATLVHDPESRILAGAILLARCPPNFARGSSRTLQRRSVVKTRAYILRWRDVGLRHTSRAYAPIVLYIYK